MIKVTKTTRQNLILLVLAVVFFFIAKAGVDDMAVNPDGIGVFLIMAGGLPFIGFAVAFIVRLWQMD
jgi:hypothetical protein